MGSGTDPEAVEREIRIDAPREVVFSYLSDPTRMHEWIGRAVEIDPRPGGVLRIDVNGRDVVLGRIVDVDPPRFLAFTWGWDREGASLPPGASRVEIRLEEDGDGTRLRLRHLDLPDDVREEHAGGWEHYLRRLGRAAVGDDPGPDPLDDPDIVHGSPGSHPRDLTRDEPDTDDGA